MPTILTAAAVLRYQPAARCREIPDAGCQGLRLLVHPSGKKTWAMRFRRPGGRQGKLTLGPVDLTGESELAEPTLGSPLTLAGARKLVGQIQHQRAQGRDVIEDLATEKSRRDADRAQRAQDTFSVRSRDFIEQHARAKNRRWAETAKLLGLNPDNLEPIPDGLAHRWRDKPLTDITGHDIYRIIDEVRHRGVPGARARRKEGVSDPLARAMFAALSKLFGWLVAHRHLTLNPCQGVWRPDAPAARDRVLSEDEIRWFWLACDTLDEPFGPLLRLLLLTGQRRDEVTRLTWGELNGDTWTIPAARTKNGRPHVVPLAPAARETIEAVRRVAGRPSFVFTTTGKTSVSGFSKAKLRLDAAMLALAQERDPEATIQPWRLHDLRRTAATSMAEIGISPHIVEAVLNHVSGHRAGVAGVYNRAAYATEKRIALERWAAHVLVLIAEK